MRLNKIRLCLLARSEKGKLVLFTTGGTSLVPFQLHCLLMTVLFSGNNKEKLCLFVYVQTKLGENGKDTDKETYTLQWLMLPVKYQRER